MYDKLAHMPEAGSLRERVAQVVWRMRQHAEYHKTVLLASASLGGDGFQTHLDGLTKNMFPYIAAQEQEAKEAAREMADTTDDFWIVVANPQDQIGEPQQ